MNKKRYIIILSILIISIALISIYIELVIKSQNQSMNSERISPFAVYIHANLSIIMDGKPIQVPSQIGIEDHLWNDHSLDKFGFPGMAMDKEGKTNMPGMAPIYTTNDRGRITIGSVVERDYSVDEFLKVWDGLDTEDKIINATVNGQIVDDYRNIIFKDKAQIRLNIYSHQ